MFSKFVTLLCILPFISSEELKPIALPEVLPQDDPLKLNDIVITGSQIDGNIVINGDTDKYDIVISGSTIHGDITFDNGCAVVEDTVHECDGTQRKMNKVEKVNMSKRRAFIQRQQKINGSAGNKVIRAKQSNKAKKQKTKNNHGKTKKQMEGSSSDDGSTFSPCRTC